MKSLKGRWNRQNESGQIIVLFAVCLLVLCAFLGLAIDIGIVYFTKAKLSTAVDATCLTAMKNLYQGTGTAQTLAINSFTANYAMSGLDVNAPTINVVFSTDALGNKLVNVDATATVWTFFIRVFPHWTTFSVSDHAQANRGKLLMTLVLDRSGSMTSNGGSAALPPAVTSFVGYFDPSEDEVAMVSVASNATVDVPINYNFVTPITNAAKALSFAGGTFGVGGLVLAKAQNDSVTVQPGQNVVKVAVYFTDGKVNEIQATLSCNGVPTLYNFGGFDTGNDVDFFDPTTGAAIYDFTPSGGGGGGTWYKCNNSDCSSKTVTTTSCLKNVAGFTSTQYGTIKPFTRANVTAEAQYQALQIATAMQSEGMYIYSVGLGTSVDQSFLQQIANDPASASYNPNEPEGLAVFASNCPSSQCTTQLTEVFQTIAAKILLRLTQ